MEVGRRVGEGAGVAGAGYYAALSRWLVVPEWGGYAALCIGLFMAGVGLGLWLGIKVVRQPNYLAMTLGTLCVLVSLVGLIGFGYVTLPPSCLIFGLGLALARRR
jgi:hypothetical protein